jgi:hypothetical protein
MITKTIDFNNGMLEEERIAECYHFIKDILEKYGCEFDCSLILSGNEQHFIIDVVTKKKEEKDN